MWFRQPFLLIFLSLLPIQHPYDHSNQPAYARQRSYRHKNQLAGGNEQLRFPAWRVVRRPRNDNHLRIGNYLCPVTRMIWETHCQRVNEVGCSAQSENGIWKVQTEVSWLGELRRNCVTDVAILSCGSIRNSRAWKKIPFLFKKLLLNYLFAIFKKTCNNKVALPNKNLF